MFKLHKSQFKKKAISKNNLLILENYSAKYKMHCLYVLGYIKRWLVPFWSV